MDDRLWVTKSCLRDHLFNSLLICLMFNDCLSNLALTFHYLLTTKNKGAANRQQNLQ